MYIEKNWPPATMIIKARDLMRLFRFVLHCGQLGVARPLTLLLIVYLSLVGPAHAQQVRDTLKVGYLDVPPLTYQAENGRAEGVFIELTRQVAEEAGYDLEFRYLPISRAYFYLRTGGIDVWPGATDIPALENQVLESFVSPFSLQLSAWGVQNAPPVAHFNDLIGKTLILIAGYTHSGLDSVLESSPAITVIYAPNHRAGVAMLARGRGDYLLGFRQAVRAVLKEFPVPGIRDYPVRTRNAAWVFSLANPRSAQLRDEFDNAYLRLADRGEVPLYRAFSEGFVLPGLPQSP
ncbi:transporter substrate-binding domain-containing protein [Marinobacter sp. ATCH36]|uniref:substrate-binding periplasmic protein n=1 Tax=Marinobacter sp. ATCH36 TaxID=2945106 RepID=UPI00202221A7|nr:transporter substrate-binding domain-containing protein [Marinobacter sp. ATCH36]MCL7942769.1 transporter substrate-binding domain-containing protein [Marinobacter sp. ATCH36]